METNKRLSVFQSCQDPILTEKFRAFHEKLVNQIIQFCIENNINDIDEFYLSGDCLNESIPYGKWSSGTDSTFIFKKYTDEFKEVMSCKKIVDEKEYNRILSEQENFLYSM